MAPDLDARRARCPRCDAALTVVTQGRHGAYAGCPRCDWGDDVANLRVIPA
jgi:uncharacterized paraquat-inducible protein A